jgi:heptosyltransferase II
MPLLKDFSSIALIQTAFIGDVALALYTAQAIRNLHPTVHIGFVTTPAAAPLVQCASAVDEIIPFDKRGLQRGPHGMLDIARALHGFECIVSAHRSLRTSIISRITPAQYTVGFTTASAAWLYKARVPHRRELHEAERILELLRTFEDVPATLFTRAPQPNITISHFAQEATNRLLATLAPSVSTSMTRNNLILVAPGSVWATKRWNEAHCIAAIQLLRKQEYTIALIGSAADVELCERIALATGVLTLAGKTTLPMMLTLLQAASVLLCNDSAPVHLANLVGCRVVSIFGPTVPAFGFAPRGNDDIVLENAALSCRPCSPHGTAQCPIGTHDCMKSITAEAVVQAIHG